MKKSIFRNGSAVLPTAKWLEGPNKPMEAAKITAQTKGTVLCRNRSREGKQVFFVAWPIPDYPGLTNCGFNRDMSQDEIQLTTPPS